MAAPSTLPELKRRDTLEQSKQTTTRKPIFLEGIGLFTGENVSLTIEPLPADRGIVFQRLDLPGSPDVGAVLENVVSTPRCTILGKEEATIQTVEHLLAALTGLGVDNALIKLSGPEVPILDGSSAPFVTAIKQSGITTLDVDRRTYRLTKALDWSRGDVHLVALPCDTFRISYTLHFPQSELLHSQFYATDIDAGVFEKEIAPCRTFCLYEEIAPFIEQGLIKGGGLENAVIIKEEKIVNPEGIRFPEEMARHKILDLIGDFSLVPHPFTAHIIAIRSGHAANIEFASELARNLKENDE